MSIVERDQVAALVDEVLKRMSQQGLLGVGAGQAGAPAAAPAAAVVPGTGAPVRINPSGIYATLDEAAAAARAAQRQLMELSLVKRREIIEAMRRTAIEHARSLAEHAVRETGLGRVEHKVLKNVTAAEKTPGVEDIVQVAWTGDHGLTLVERAPWGVIGSVTPTTNPTSTVINNSLSFVAGGNAAVFCFHPNAKNCSIAAMELLNAAIVKAGGPESLLTCVAEPNIEVAQALMKHRGIDALLVTGGPAVVKEALRSGKRVWGAGPGNPPTVVDATADLDRAARDIVSGCGFDNTVLCTGEKEAFVVSAVADQLKQLMVQHGAHEVKWSEVDRLQRLLILEEGGKQRVNPKMIGKDAAVILQAAGISFQGSPKCVIVEVTKDHPFVFMEMLLPVLPIVRVKDVDQGIDWAIEAEGPRKHTASIHSNDIRPMHRMAREWGGSIFVKNGPHYAGIGVGGEGYATLSIAGATGEGLTSAKTFTKERRCTLVGHFRIV